MFRSQMRQICCKCNGSGTTREVLKDPEGKVLLAPPYHKGEGDKPQFVPCVECAGSGWAMYEAPRGVMIEGEEFPLEESERRSRFNDATV